MVLERQPQEVTETQGYFIGYGYKGFVNGAYRLFANESEYNEIISQQDGNCKEELEN